MIYLGILGTVVALYGILMMLLDPAPAGPCDCRRCRYRLAAELDAGYRRGD